MSFDLQDRISVFGALRPDGAQSVSRAVVATYSLDLIALLGLVLTLGGDGEAEFENSPLGLVKAFDSVRGRLQVLHQVGRIIAPRAHRAVLPLLDTMVVAIPANEGKHSWHPKIALVRYEGDFVQWRFWIGSRNLTGSRDLDAGLMLVSSRDKTARAIPDIAELARDLLAEAKLTDGEIEELQAVRWISPRGTIVRRLLWRRPGDTRPFIVSPFLRGGERASAVSPFIDRTGLREVLGAGSAQVSLLTTDASAADCAPMGGFSFRTVTAPDPEMSVSVEQQLDDKEAEFTDQLPSGVHAKLLAVSRGGRTSLMLGSANLTKRGLVGPNAEAVAILDVTEATLADSLHDFVQTGFEFEESRIDEGLATKEEALRVLDGRIALLLESELSLSYAADGLALLVGKEADTALASARFDVSPFLNPDGWVELPAGTRSLQLVSGPVTISEQTSLVTFRASSLGDPAIQRSWVLSLPVAALDVERRDRALLARYVGAARFRDWLRSQLEGFDGTVGERWTEGFGSGQSQEGSRIPDMFTLETMLAGWARDPKSFERRTAAMVAMLDSFRDSFEALPDEEERRAALADLAEVQPFLRAVHDAVHGGH